MVTFILTENGDRKVLVTYYPSITLIHCPSLSLFLLIPLGVTPFGRHRGLGKDKEGILGGDGVHGGGYEGTA